MMDEKAAVLACLLAEWGFSGRYIQTKLKQAGTDVHRSTIYRYVREAGLSLWDYRNGKSRLAKTKAAEVASQAKGGTPKRKAG
jgi:hypothetical protein